MPKCIPRNDCLPFLMRFFLVMEVLIGIAFVVFALVLQTPPKAAVPMCAPVLSLCTLSMVTVARADVCKKCGHRPAQMIAADALSAKGMFA